MGCGNRGDSEGDSGGGIAPVASEGGSESGGDRNSGTEGTEGSGGDIELPPETGGDTGDVQVEACESFDLDLKPQPTNLMLVIDRSGSMVKNKLEDSTVTRWESLHGVVADVTEKFEGAINFGAQIYPGQSSATGVKSDCFVASGPEVGIQSGARDKILAAIPPANATIEQVKGATPTYAAYASALEQLKAAEAQTNATTDKDHMPPVMVLITDGVANCGVSYFEEQDQIDKGFTPATCEPYSEILSPVSQEGVECFKAWHGVYDSRIHTAVENAASEHKIKTYVIGIGIEDKEVFVGGKNGENLGWPTVNAHEKLNDLAVKGGTASDEDTKYFSAKNKDSLLSALDEIAASVVSCTVAMGRPIPPAQVPFVELTLKGQKLPFLKNADSCEGKNGWRWLKEPADHSSLELCGDSCETLKVEAALDVVVGCEPPE